MWQLPLGFILLVLGVPVAILLPELGVPMLLFSTRLLGRKYLWARKVNAWVSSNWIKTKNWLSRIWRRREK